MPESMIALDGEDPVRDASVEREQGCVHPGFPSQVGGLSATCVYASPQESFIKDGGNLRVFSEQARRNATKSAIGVDRGGRAASGVHEASGGYRRRKDPERQESIAAAVFHEISSLGDNFVRLYLHEKTVMATTTHPSYYYAATTAVMCFIITTVDSLFCRRPSDHSQRRAARKFYRSVIYHSSLKRPMMSGALDFQSLFVLSRS